MIFEGRLSSINWELFSNLKSYKFAKHRILSKVSYVLFTLI